MSTRDSKNDRAIERFFTKELMPIADVRTRAGCVFPIGPDESAATYYKPRVKRRVTADDFEKPSILNPEELEGKLTAMWEESGDDDLVPLAASLAHLAGRIYAVKQEHDDISPFIYVMY